MNRGKKNEAYRLQIGSKSLYDFLLSIGLTANKPLTLGALDIPQQYFSHFLRGVIDGDGNIQKWVHSHNLGEQWSLRVYGGSKLFLEWLLGRIEVVFGVQGKVHVNTSNRVFVLKYGKIAAQAILRCCYSENVFGLKRKFELAKACVGAKTIWMKSPAANARVVELVDTRDSGNGSPLW